MAPGPPPLGTLDTNRFALLADSSRVKKKKGKSLNKNRLKMDISDIFEFPNLPLVKQNTNDPKYITIESAEQNKPILKFSCFAIHKATCAVSTEINTVSELRDGKILLLVKNKKIAERFIALKQLPGICNIKAKYHETLNCTKGTVFAPFLSNVSESEIVNELSAQGVVAAYKFQRKNEKNQLTSTGVVLLTFDSYNLPNQLDIAWRKVNVRQYIPNPMRCKNCQLLGHTIKHCKGKAACNNCNLPPHNPETCTRTFCANCHADHPASFNKCPKYIQAKKIQTIRTTKKCTMREAIKIYNSTATLPENGPSFSSTVSRPANKHNRQDNSPPSDIHSAPNSSNSFKSPNTQDNSAPSDTYSVSNSSHSFISSNTQDNSVPNGSHSVPNSSNSSTSLNTGDNSTPSNKHLVYNSSNSFLPLNTQESSNIYTQTHINTFTTSINESATQNPKPYSHSLSTPQPPEQEPNYHSLTQLQQTYSPTLNNTLFDSRSNSAPNTSIYLSNNNNTNLISSSSANTSQHTDDNLMSTEVYPGISSDDE